MPKHYSGEDFPWESASLRNLDKLRRLEERLVECTAKMERRSQKTIEAMETDRKVISKRIYDSIACTLAAIKMQLEDRIRTSDQAPPPDTMSLEKIVTHLSKAINESRNISRAIRTHSLDDFGLKPALLDCIQNFKHLYPGIEVVSQIEIEGQDLATDIQTVVYRVVQEALENVGKHSKATKVNVELTVQQNQIHLELADNGFGFDLQTTQPDVDSLTGYGLHSIRERVEISRGVFHIRSEPGQGTTIEVTIPF